MESNLKILSPELVMEPLLALLDEVTAVRRKSALLQKGNFWWEFFEKLWIRIVPVRPVVRNAYSFIKQLFYRKEFI